MRSFDSNRKAKTQGATVRLENNGKIEMAQTT